MTVDMTPLPRGRHGLSREEVEASQRVRLVRAMAEVMAEKGYARTSIADTLRRARVSRETFYELFSSKEDCFMTAFEQANRHLVSATTAGGAAAAEGGQKAGIDLLDRILADYLSALAADPVAARVFLIEVYAAGESALKRRLELQTGIVDAIAAVLGATKPDDRFAVEMFLAGLVQMITARLAVNDVDGLRALHAPAMRLARRVGLAT